ncbi:hypothetical protein PRABACTJOHN_02513 [Parabacteroides johnsonii DSM 18315]|uniref:Uncharacterized protein n=1 Tax=Parabacteroides johnsonii DSM 18315 TaxID=537006 RepID=B7BBV1_9BACT|nr:hypothetical protein PRABACTJOHN_02513 [Parabacteroides johnsonii DSM 18315]
MDKDICAESIVPETRQKLPIVIPFRNKFFKVFIFFRVLH